MKRLRFALATSCLCSVALLQPLLAFEERGEATAPDPGVVDESAIPPVIQVHNDKGIPYITGGIGDEEQQALSTMAPKFNLKLTFARRDLAFHADTILRISDQNGKEVLAAEDVGPFFLAKLPPGKYRITAENAGENAGKAQVQTASVARGRQTSLSFYW
jgi:hypothetical protein